MLAKAQPFAAMVKEQTVLIGIHYLHFLFRRRGRASTLRKLRSLLGTGRPPDPTWVDLDLITRQAISTGHPESEWLSELAKVMAGQATSDTLADWPLWSVSQPRRWWPFR